MAGQTLVVSLIQSDLFWEDKQSNLEKLASKIRGISEKTELIILPEMFSTGFTMRPQGLAEPMDGKTILWMQSLAKERRAIITGSVIISEGGSYFNRLIWMLPDGNYGFYDKRHLFSFAGEHEQYSIGNKKFVGSVNGWKINLQICYDLRFPVWARQPSDPESYYDIYINVANWPEKRRQAWMALLTARAIENQCYVIGVNRVGIDGNQHKYSGDSMLIDPLGKVLWNGADEEVICTYTLQKSPLDEVRSRFPFLGDADDFQIMK